MNRLIILLIISIYIYGCSWIIDFPRSMWGSSVRVLSDKRDQALSKEFSCSRDECFDEVLQLTLPYGVEDPENDKFLLFLKDKKKRHMIIMDVPASVDTTEVGVFFDSMANGKIKVDISSLSSRAKEKAAGIIFTKLGTRFQDVP